MLGWARWMVVLAYVINVWSFFRWEFWTIIGVFWWIRIFNVVAEHLDFLFIFNNGGTNFLYLPFKKERAPECRQSAYHLYIFPLMNVLQNSKSILKMVQIHYIR